MLSHSAVQLFCDAMDYSAPGSSVHGIFRVRILCKVPILWPLGAKSWLMGKDPDAGKDWGQDEKGVTTIWSDGIINTLDVSRANSGRSWRTGKPGMLQFVGLQRVRHILVTPQQQEYWSGLPFPPPRDLPDSGIEPVFPTQGWSPTLGGWFFTTALPRKLLHQLYHYLQKKKKKRL